MLEYFSEALDQISMEATLFGSKNTEDKGHWILFSF